MGNVETQNFNLSDAISDVFVEIGKSKEQQREVDELLSLHKIPRGTFNELLANPEKLEHLEHIELVLLVDTLHKISRNDSINPLHFFSEKEIKQAAKYRRSVEEEIKLPYSIEGVIRVTNENYLCALSYKEIAKLWNHKILTYNFQTQRLSKKKLNSKGQIVERPDIKTKSVKNIIRLMKEGKYDPSTLLFNIVVDGKSSIEYEDGVLTINEGSTVNLIDGAHRVMAIVELLEEDPDFEGYMNIDIKHFPIPKAQRLLAITNTVNRFDKTLVKYYGGEEYGQEITKYLMELPVLKNRIEIKTALDKKITITNFAIVSEGIQNIFDPQDTKEKYDVQEVLKKFFEYFMPTYHDVLIVNRQEALKTSWFPHHNMFVGFLTIAKKLYDKYGKDFPVDEIVRIVDSIDFNKETSPLTEIMAGQGKANSNKVKEQIHKFFDEKVDELLA